MLPGTESRRIIHASLDIPNINSEEIWSVITDYRSLGDFIPSLSRNVVVEERPDGGVVLDQSARQKVSPLLTFHARCKLLVKEQLDHGAKSSSGSSGSSEEDSPYSLSFDAGDGVSSSRHLMFQMIEGDNFSEFHGMWRVSSIADGDKENTRLCYIVNLKPKGWIPIKLMRPFISKQLQSNLRAIAGEAAVRKAEKTAYSGGVLAI